MGTQIHTKFTDDQVKELLQKYINGEVERKYIQEILGVKKAMFFRVLKSYRNNPNEFSVGYKRSGPTRSIDPEIKKTKTSYLIEYFEKNNPRGEFVLLLNLKTN